MAKKLACILLALLLTCLAGSIALAQVVDGVYTGSAPGNNGPVQVEVEVKDGAVQAVRVVAHEETPGICDKPVEEIPAAIVKNQSLSVDTIAGATNTSAALLAATEAAMAQAGIDVEAWKADLSAGEAAPAAMADATCQTVVVGAGGAGMKTAIELKKAGHDVILVEKMPFVGGATSLAATYFVAVNTAEQQAAGFGLDIDQYVKDKAALDPNLNTDNLTRMLYGSQESLDWLNALGTKINRPLSNYQVGTEDGSSLGVAIVKAMKAEMEKTQVDCRLETRAMELIEQDGKVAGVVVENGGTTYSILADNVVLATGGFASGAEAVAEYAPDWAGLPSTSAAGATGDGAVMAKKAGASLKFMDVVRLNPSVHSENGVNSSLSAARAEGGIMVNQNGERFCNDYYPDYTQLSKWMLEQDGDYVYIVIDQKSMDASKRLQGFKEKGYFLEGQTPAELAEKMGVPVENFVRTVETYAEAVRRGEDKAFGRKSNMSTDFTNPPYYASVTVPGLQVTLGGVEVNENMQVLTEAGEVFSNLYAVGEVAHDGLFGGGPTNINLFFGKVVAEHILAKG